MLCLTLALNVVPPLLTPASLSSVPVIHPQENEASAPKVIPHADAVKALAELAAGDKQVPQLVLEFAAHLANYNINVKNFEFDSW